MHRLTRNDLNYRPRVLNLSGVSVQRLSPHTNLVSSTLTMNAFIIIVTTVVDITSVRTMAVISHTEHQDVTSCHGHGCVSVSNRGRGRG